MGKKRRNHPDLEQLLTRPWCYYCERDFEDLKLLISHQKAKHYKCERCGRRLNTAGGLSVHMNQVHKETLSHVENAIEGREGLEVEIFGMEGVPEDAMARRTQEIMQTFQKSRASRQAVTGNPQPGTHRPAKKLKIETADEIKRRLAEYRAQGGARKAAEARQQASSGNGGSGGTPAEPMAVDTTATSPSVGALPPPPPAFGFGAPGSISLPNRPPSGAPGAPGLPQRPSVMSGPPPGIRTGIGAASTLDDLVAGASHQQPADDIDRAIRMAEAGIRPAPPAHDRERTEKSEKSDKKREKSRMVYGDGDSSVEERMGSVQRFAVAV